MLSLKEVGKPARNRMKNVFCYVSPKRTVSLVVRSLKDVETENV